MSGGLAQRLTRAWSGLAPEQRLAAVGAAGLFATMFLPWYEKSFVPKGATAFVKDGVSAFGAFSFVEAAVLLVAAGALVLLFARGERRAFHLPGGDGSVLLFAGLWVELLLVWRLFDKPDVEATAAGAPSTGLQWGIFFAMAAAALFAYAGSRIRTAHRPEPPLPAAGSPPPEPPGGAVPADTEATRVMPRRRARRQPPRQGTRLFPVEGDPEPHVPSLFPPPDSPDEPPAPPDELEHRPAPRRPEE